jgi:hypothetical protein
MEMGMLLITWGQAFLYVWESDQQLRRYNLYSSRILYITVRGCWCDTVLNVLAPNIKATNQKIASSRKYRMKINFLGNFDVKVGTEYIFKPTVGNESLREVRNDNGVRVVNFATPRNLIVKSVMFTHRNILKYT